MKRVCLSALLGWHRTAGGWQFEARPFPWSVRGVTGGTGTPSCSPTCLFKPNLNLKQDNAERVVGDTGRLPAHFDTPEQRVTH